MSDDATGPFYHDHPANNPDVKPWPFDLVEAARLLDEAGWQDTDGDGVRDKVVEGKLIRLEFTMLAFDKAQTRLILERWAQDLKKVGVEMKREHVAWPRMQELMDERNFDAWTGGWGLSWEIDPFQIWHSSQADIPKGSNRGGFRNAQADEIIETLRATFDTNERIKLARQFHALVHEEQPYTFFYAPRYVAAWQPRLKNVHFNKIRPHLLPLTWFVDSEK